MGYSINADEEFLQPRNTVLTFFYNKEEWERHEVVMDVPGSGKDLLIGLSFRKRGACYIKDIVLEIVPGSVPVTLDRYSLRFVNNDRPENLDLEKFGD